MIWKNKIFTAGQSAAHIPGILNTEVDKEPRKSELCAGWKLVK